MGSLVILKPSAIQRGLMGKLSPIREKGAANRGNENDKPVR